MTVLLLLKNKKTDNMELSANGAAPTSEYDFLITVLF
jgi:hypothetical protein